MPEFTTNEWVILFLVLVLGWLLGLLSRSGGRRWRREYEREHAERLALEESHRTRIAASDARIAELERRPPVATTDARRGDDLSLIRGIGRTGEARLNEIGVYRYQEIATLSASDEASLEERLDLDRGTIGREGWREQAELLASGRSDEQRRRFA